MRKSILIGIGVGVLFSVIAWSHWYRMNSAPNGLKKAAEALSTRDLDTVDIYFDISSVAESLADAMLMRYAAISSHDDILGGTDFETARKVMAARLESGLQYVVRHGLLYEPFYSYEHDLDIPIDELILRARLHEAEVVDIREDVRDGNLSRVSLRLRYTALDTVLIYRVSLHKLNSGWRVVAVGDPVTLAETVEAASILV